VTGAPELKLGPVTEGRGFVVVLPGGGYRLRAEHETTPPLDWLAARGWRAGALPYTVDPAPYPLPLAELLGALADVRAGRYGAVEGPVGVLGFSAGGHLAGLAATATPDELAAADSGAARPDFAVLAYPVVSLVRHPHLGSRAALLADRADEPGLAERLSLESRVDAATPPVFAWTTADDETVDARNSLLLAARLVEHRVPVELHVLPNGAHGLGMAPEAAWRPAARWLERIREPR